MALLEVQHISKRDQDNVIIDDISFQQEALQKIAIAGESGAGKTTISELLKKTIDQYYGKNTDMKFECIIILI